MIAKGLPLLGAWDPASLLGSLEQGTGVSLVGLPPTARAFVLLHLARPRPGVTVVIARSDAEADNLARDIRGLAALTGIGDLPVSTLPALDADPYDGLAAHLGAVTRRVRFIRDLMDGALRVAIVPARALLIPLPPMEALAGFFPAVREGARFETVDDPGWYLAAGYRRVDLATDPGEYSRRGGILDIITPIDDPVRMELEGDTVISLRHFDPSDQRSTRRVESVRLAPARETVLGPAERDRLAAALGRDPDGSRVREILETRGEIPGIEACARILYPGAMGALRFIASVTRQKPILVCDELEMTLDELGRERADLERASEGEPGLPPPERLILPEEDLESALRAAPVRLRELAVEGEAMEEGRVIERFHSSGIPSYRGRLDELMGFIGSESGAGRTVCIVMKSPGRTQRMKEVLEENDLPSRAIETITPGDMDGGILLGTATLGGGFTLPEAGLTIVSEQEIFGEEVRHRKRAALPAFTSDFRDLNPGDLVVHVDHGVGRYEGLSRVGGGDGQEVDVMVLSYDGGDKLFLPVTRLDLVQKYSGVGGRIPNLDKLGGTGWVKTKKKVKKAMQDMAVELLNLYAARKAISGHAFSADSEWQGEFEAGFPYEMTPDQAISVNEIKRDMESPTPMDRLLCGDVGFGKTEVALRAAFKAVMDGKQVAVLAPTTVLTFQHTNTFRQRFASFPVKIESLSRFRTPRERKAVATGAATGAVDIVIGTHRLLSKDVSFKDLGLLIVDEEQRFGVAHKERLKKLKKSVDVLTMTATPIPRTLQMSLMGVRDLSVIETPPENRLAIQTHLVPFKEAIIQSAIQHELARDGQVYLVHNRVESVHEIAAMVKRHVPEAIVGVAHGQMPEKDLEETMVRFLRGEFSVLVSTTIIENGLDIPRVNTLIVNRADQFGLSQLYQLRGRIGRSDRQAYAYLMIPPQAELTEIARKRLKALQEFTDLGSGFRIAARDLEIRGAGNLLGPAQSGHIASLGFELYCRMLERAVEEQRRGEGEMPEFRTSINLAVDVKIPESYIGDEHHRLMFYKRIASATALEDLDRIRDEMKDRYGQLPRQGLNILEIAGLRILAEKLQVQQCDYRSESLVIKFGETSPVDPERLLSFVSRRKEATFSPPAVLRIKGKRADADRLQLAREVLTTLA